MLTGAEIKKRIENETIRISDFDESRLNPNSYNLRLGKEIRMYVSDVIDSKKDNFTVSFIMQEDEGFILKPGQLYLSSTMERTWAKDLIPCISGRSSIARLGIEIHRTAGFGDIGFEGTWTLEITAAHPVRIYPGMEICQIYFEEAEGEIAEVYHGKYQHQNSTVASRLYKEYE